MFVSFWALLTTCSCRTRPATAFGPVGGATTRPDIDFRVPDGKIVYRALADGGFLFKKFHFSGLVYIKSWNDTAVRAVFQNEMGYTFFDFGWDAKDSFQVHDIIGPMNKPALIKTLKKDLELLLGKGLPKAPTLKRKDENGNETYRYPLAKGVADYRFDTSGHLFEIQNKSEKERPVVTICMRPPGNKPLSDTLSIRHHRARFKISFTRIVPIDPHALN